MSSLSDAERDADEVVRVLAALSALLSRAGDPDGAETRRLLSRLAEDGGAPAARVLAYLRDLRGPGDGEAVAVPTRLGLWREWSPARGNVLGSVDQGRFGEAVAVVRPGIERRGGGSPAYRPDPGE